jgi:hydrogenase nickel incorporation protein HypA/HybF
MGIIDIVTGEVERSQASGVEEVELDIGCLSGVEMTSFEFAWKQAIRNTALQNAVTTIHRPEGKGRCLDCGETFPVAHLYDACPHCGSHWIRLLDGRQLKVRSILVT